MKGHKSKLLCCCIYAAVTYQPPGQNSFSPMPTTLVPHLTRYRVMFSLRIPHSSSHYLKSPLQNQCAICIMYTSYNCMDESNCIDFCNSVNLAIIYMELFVPYAAVSTKAGDSEEVLG